ncbi:MAG: hypothetical protein ACJAYN_001617 [Bermanella sp.]|uniref:DUF3025 domain-containing protein n=1 Tax=Glaciecola sp. 33A TaxID=2057807 RepID=UPI000C337E49|nr:DUF3025 domain-containing protein [Glaciecola sp. 33A]PKH99873.1 DUF3025 domain-containing protein [Glaciecola sp. 33A]
MLLKKFNDKTIVLDALISSPFLRPPLSALSLLFPSQDLIQLDITRLDANLLEKMRVCFESDMNLVAWGKRFICQESMPEDVRYYEQIIFEDNAIPTRRESWHDFFNGIIWLQFPQTKTYLNHLHISEIDTHGLDPRTKVRNHITHFDECGIVLFITGTKLLAKLAFLFDTQEWTTIFCELKEEWHTRILPVVFGHANLEMLLTPFVGLTGKVLLIQIDDKQRTQGLSSLLGSRVLDTLLVQHIQTNQTLFSNKPFYPLPILGIPHWHYGPQDLAFYTNEGYFMPKRKKVVVK